jgi:SAM-dependent methyltransferase
MSANCLFCKSDSLKQVFYEQRIPLVPNAPLVPENFDSEIFADLDIVQCQDCSLIYNRAFLPENIDKIYTKNYSSGIPNSPKVLERYISIIEQSILKENIENKCIIEIGASDFTFSKLLIEAGGKKVIAFEPSDLFANIHPQIQHINTFFAVDKIPVDSSAIDLIVMRHVLEHLPDPLTAINELSSLLKIGAKIYIEVPDAEDIIAQNRFYDFFYEHVSYFNPQLLTQVMEKFGFKVLSISPLVEGQHFGMLCEKTQANLQEKVTINKAENIQSVDKFRIYTEEFLKQLQAIVDSYEKVAIYGAGNHGLGVGALLNLESQKVRCFLDLNKMKEGKYSPKTHIPILPPEVEKLKELDAIVIIASLHQDEIAKDLRNKYQFSQDLWGTYPNIFKIA